jgi:ADP-heptose:LPS heptosyltransferase
VKNGQSPTGKKLEKFGKRTAEWLLGLLASRHRRKWHGLGNLGQIKKAIVIRQHNQFGDVLCTIPLLRALKMKFNLTELAVVVSPQNIDAIRGCKYVDKIINYDKLAFYKKPSLFLTFFKELRHDFDLLLVPSNVSMSLTNDVMAFFIHAKTKVGPKSLEAKPNKTGSVYDVAIDLQWNVETVHQSHRNMQVAVPLGIDPTKESRELEYAVDEMLLNRVRSFVNITDRASHLKIAIHAGAGKVSNRWNVWNFAKLAEELHDNFNAELFFTEGSFDHEIVEHLTNLLKIPFVRVRNRPIQFVAALLKQMNLVITNDTGIMHLSAAVGTPTLSLFGPTDPLQWSPIGDKHRYILGRNGDVNSIEVEKVLNLVKKLIVKI